MTAHYSFWGLILQTVLVNLLFAFIPIHSQNLKDVRINLHVENISIEQVLGILEKKTDFKFLYIKDELPLSEKVSIKVEDGSLQQILGILEKKFDLNFTQLNSQIIIKKASKKDVGNIEIENDPGSIKGTVTDGSDGSALWGTNIIIAGTTVGTTTDTEGKFIFGKLQPGKVMLIFRYIGYQPDSVEVNVVSGKTVQIDVILYPRAIEGKEIVVSAQLQGQAAAINQQLNSNTIVNVVSKDRIEELPDQNAAESVGRLPGISIKRDAGEGTQVIVRGLAPKFNSITLNGQRIPATDPENRSVDLSMISSDMLAGIEVVKALTPDKDGDAIGGMVNFETKKASAGLQGDFKIQGGYNSNADDFKNYRGSLSLGNRYFDNSLGVIFTCNIQEADRGSDVLSADYRFLREQTGNETSSKIAVTNLYLSDRVEKRNRYGANLVLDYDLGNGSIVLNGMYARTERDEVRRRKSYKVDAAYVEYWLRNREMNIDMFSTSLNGKHNIGPFQVNWQSAYLFTRQDMPFSHESQFREVGAYNENLVEDKGPELIPLGAKNNLDETTFFQDYSDKELIKDGDFTAQIDAKLNFSLSNNIGGELKFGGKYRDKNRDRDKTQLFTRSFGIDKIGKANPDLFDVTREGKIKISNFYDEDYEVDDFLNGRYVFGPAKALDPDKLNRFMNQFAGSYYRNYAMDLQDYNAGEKILAGYIMSTINIGSKLILLPGFRYEKTTTDYSSPFGFGTYDEEGNLTRAIASDTVGTRTYDNFFPMIHVKYSFNDWIDLRVAVTRSLSRPDYFSLVPYERISYFSGTVERGDPYLKPAKVWNYDMFLSFYGNLGLATIGGYYKTLRDIDYIRTSRITTPGSTYGFTLTQPENSVGETKLYGIEIEVQTNLRFLPSPFDGIVININYSHIHSETDVPLLKDGPRSTFPPFDFTFVDTVRTVNMPGQADNLVNLTLGYEKGNFSGRISLMYQGSALQIIGTREELDGYSDEFIRWDFAMQYKFFDKIAVTMDVNNLTNLAEKSFLGIQSYPTAEEYFGWTVDLGIRYEF